MDKQQIKAELLKIMAVVDARFADRTDITEEMGIMSDLGVDSLQVSEIIFEIEDRFEIKISEEEARTLRTVGDLVKMVETKTASTPR
jgi:acyl carrier protein